VGETLEKKEDVMTNFKRDVALWGYELGVIAQVSS